MNVANLIIEKREAIEKIKTKKAQAEGKLESLIDKLKKDFGFTDLDKVEEKMAELEKSIATLQKKIEVSVKKLQEFDWESVE